MLSEESFELEIDDTLVKTFGHCGDHENDLNAPKPTQNIIYEDIISLTNQASTQAPGAQAPETVVPKGQGKMLLYGQIQEPISNIEYEFRLFPELNEPKKLKESPNQTCDDG